MTLLSPRSSAELIAMLASDVKVKRDGIQKIAQLVLEGFKKNEYSLKSWKNHELNPKTMDKSAVDWIFLVDTLNFSFWSEDPKQKYGVEFNGKLHTGYWSLCAALNRALKEGIPVTSAEYYSTMTKEQFQYILRSDTELPIPLIDERYTAMKAAGEVLMKKFNGSFVNCVERCEGSAQQLVKLIVSEFPSYKDEAIYAGFKVSFYKRAQIVVADIWACFEGQGLGAFQDMDTLTMFADYRVPQVLAYFGALQYSEALMEKLKKGELINSGDKAEVEIRGCSVWAVELVKEELKKLAQENATLKDVPLNSCIIDFYLWDYRQEYKEEVDKIPFHKVRCIFY